MKPDDIVVDDLDVDYPNWWTNQHPVTPEQLKAAHQHYQQHAAREIIDRKEPTDD